VFTFAKMPTTAAAVLLTLGIALGRMTAARNNLICIDISQKVQANGATIGIDRILAVITVAKL
jgi:hypothetical protein